MTNADVPDHVVALTPDAVGDSLPGAIAADGNGTEHTSVAVVWTK